MKVIDTITANNLRIHQFNSLEFCTLCDAENLIHEFINSYDEGTVLMSPNTGEIVLVDELRRVAGILDFLTTNRVVEIA